jgi:hypothetical protein
MYHKSLIPKKTKGRQKLINRTLQVSNSKTKPIFVNKAITFSETDMQKFHERERTYALGVLCCSSHTSSNVRRRWHLRNLLLLSLVTPAMQKVKNEIEAWRSGFLCLAQGWFSYGGKTKTKMEMREGERRGVTILLSDRILLLLYLS